MASIHPLVLVDGSSYLYRAFHALPPLNTSKGHPTGAIKGVISMLRSLKKTYSKSVIVVIFDAKGKTFRDDMFPAYKANRSAMPDDLRPQVEPIHEIVRAMGLPLLAVAGVEADDVIGTLAQQATEQAIPVVVSTGDKDMAQLVNQHVTLVNTMTNTVMDEAGVVEKFGIPAHYIIDYLALMGDKVDNIPGVAGVGEKTALGLIKHLGGIDEIYQKLDQVDNVPVRGAKKLAEKLATNEDEARLSYQLATIKCDVALETSALSLYQGELSSAENVERLYELFSEYEFKTWMREAAAVADPTNQPSTDEQSAALTTSNNSKQPLEINKVTAICQQEIGREYETVFELDRLNAWIKKLSNSQQFAFDTETTSLNYMEATVSYTHLTLPTNREV